jgi:pyruvate dehydrogenase E2 component (dihydrolipoamide acetyltransferase)
MHEVRIPRLGWSMEEGTFVRWLKAEGETVNVGEPLYEFEGEKALQEIESLEAGVLRFAPNSPQPGDVVAVGALIGYVTSDEESSLVTSPANRVPAETAEQPRLEAPAERATASIPADWIEVPRMPVAQNTAVATPRARRIARELVVDWAELPGTGKGGRIREADVRAAATAAESSLASVAANCASAGAPVVSLSPRRKAIASRLRMGLQRSLPVTLTSSIDATRLVESREQSRSEGASVVPTFTDFIAYQLLAVLKRHLPLAARWQNDQSDLLLPGDDGLHLGIAVDTPDGLLVPVLRAADQLSLTELAVRSRELIERARNGRLAASQMQGGVFTISNLGMYGIEAFTPMINYPEVAILGVGAIRREAVVLDSGQIVAQPRLTLSLTFDHGAIDGAPAAAFLRDLGAAVECLAR